ncbi:MAG: EthD domain-containing protein [Halieaceae bacterium]
MIKLVYCIRKRADISEEEFHRYWLDEHGPLVKSVAEAIGASRYVQSHTVMPEVNAQLRQGRELPEPYDGLTEIWWETQADMDKGLNSEEGQAAAVRLLEDETKFIDFSQSRLFVTEEHEIF